MKMNLKKYRFVILSAVLTILSLSFIFGQSLMPSKTSNSESDQVIEIIRPVIDPDEKIPHRHMNFLIRKGAHLTEFAVLGFCLKGLNLALFCLNNKKMPFMAPFCALAAAVADEYIQSFSDRTSLVSDILIDFAGALAGILIMTFSAFLTAQLKHIKQNPKL